MEVKYSQLFDYAVVVNNSSSKTRFMKDIDILSQKIPQNDKEHVSKIVNEQQNRVRLKMILANCDLMDLKHCPINNLTDEALGITQELFSSSLNETIWSDPIRILPGIDQKILICWIASYTLPSFLNEKGEGRVGTYCTNEQEKIELRLAFGVPSLLNVSHRNRKIIMIQHSLAIGAWYFLANALVNELFKPEIEILGDKKDVLNAIRMGMYRLMIYRTGWSGAGGDESELRSRNDHLAIRLYKILRKEEPEKWIEITQEWLKDLMKSRKNRFVSSLSLGRSK